MQPFSREAIIDRRQPAVRWSAVVAGSVVAVSVWMLLQLFGTGVALSMLGTRDLEHVHSFGVGTSAWSVLAPLVALFLGGMLAARMAGHHDRKTAGLHGLLVWGVASLIGVIAVTSAIAMMSPSNAVMTPPLHTLSMTADDVRVHMLATADATGCAFLVSSLALALGAIAAVGGALISAHNSTRRHHDTSHTTAHTTAPYPVVDPHDGGL